MTDAAQQGAAADAAAGAAQLSAYLLLGGEEHPLRLVRWLAIKP